MTDFQKVKASKQAISQRKPVWGIGINDAWFTVKPKINGKQMIYKPYRVWQHMLQRCYSSTYQEKRPTYKGCLVCPEWHLFSVFEAWMVKQDWQGKELDKDLVKQGNKLYCPAFCRFIPQALNKLLTGRDALRGDYPMGVCWAKRDKVYLAQITIDGKVKRLGCFESVHEAKAVYNKAKYADIHLHAMLQDDPEIKAGLMNWEVK